MLSLIIMSFVIISDQTLKAYFLKALLKDESIPVIQNIFHISLVYNTGGAFGLLQNRTGLFAAISVLSILVISVFYIKSREPGLGYRLSIALILGGAISNLIDRLSHGFVIDYLDFRVWPVFNLADACITIGALLLIISSFRKR